MRIQSETLRWAAGLTIAGATITLAVGLLGAAILAGLAIAPGLEELYRTQIDPYATPITNGLAIAGIVAAWTLVTGGVGLAAGLRFRGRAEGMRLWAAAGLAAAALSVPITAGLGLGGALVIIGCVLAIVGASSALSPATGPTIPARPL